MERTSLLFILPLLGDLLTSALCGMNTSSQRQEKFVSNITIDKEMQSLYLTRNPKSLDDFLCSNIPLEMFNFLEARSPPHLFYIIYDSVCEDIDKKLKRSSDLQNGTTVMKLSKNTEDVQKILSADIAPAHTERRQVLLLCSLERVVEIFKMVSSRNKESRTIWWIVVVTSKEAADAIQDILREGSHVTVFLLEAPDSFTIASSMTMHDGKVRLDPKGKWLKTKRGYESILKKELFVNLETSYLNFNGRQLTVTANNNFVFITLKKLGNGAVVDVGGFESVIIKSLSEALNFTYRMKMPDDGKWGGPLPDGTIVGMIGDVARREAHFAICEISITGLRETVIDFTQPYYIDPVALVSRTPREKNRAFAAFSPFSPEVWLCIAIAVSLVGLCLAVESKLVKVFSPENVNLEYTLGNAIFNVFRSLLKQENLLSGHHWSHRFTLLFWYLFCLITSVLYSGMLIATLIKPSFEKPIDSLTDLPAATKDGFTVVVTGDTVFEYMFKDAKEGLYAQTWKLFNHRDRAKSFIGSITDGFETIIEDKLVLLSGELTLKYQAFKRGRKQFYFSRDTFAPQYYGAPSISGAPFLPVFNKMLSYMAEGGLVAKWVDMEFQKVAGANIDSQRKGPRAFTIMHLQGAFYILTIGFVIASVTFTLENAMHKSVFHRLLIQGPTTE